MIVWQFKTLQKVVSYFSFFLEYCCELTSILCQVPIRVPYGYSYGPSHTSKRSGLRNHSYLSLISSSQVYSMDLPFPRAVSGCISFFMYLRVLAYL